LTLFDILAVNRDSVLIHAPALSHSAFQDLSAITAVLHHRAENIVRLFVIVPLGFEKRLNWFNSWAVILVCRSLYWAFGHVEGTRSQDIEYGGPAHARRTSIV
jgi:hypothetical protein